MTKRKKVLIGLGTPILLLALCLGVFFYILFHRTPGQYFDSDGVRIYYTDQGRGEPIILIHGVAANSDINWRRPGVIRVLSRDFRVIAFDLRGHGLSGQPTDPNAYGIEMVEDIGRLMDHLGLQKAHMAGYSLGGFILLKYVTLHPERVESAAICAAGWIDPTNPIIIPNPYQPPAQTTPAAMRSADLSLFTGKNSLFHWVKNAVGDRLVNKTAIKALKKNYNQLGVPEPALEANAVPSICFVGTRDGFLPLAHDLERHMSDLQLVIFDGASHFTLPFYPSFKKDLHEFFEAHREEPAKQGPSPE
jgi:pimeloyl-ACP methyl ester carboxylesterase